MTAPAQKIPVWRLVILTAAEAAAVAGVGESTIRRAIDAGQLSPHPFFRSIRIARSELDRWASLTRIYTPDLDEDEETAA